MELAGHTYAFRERGFDDALAALAAGGFLAVDVWLGHVRDADDAAMPLRHGLRVVSLSAGGFYRPDEAAVARAVDAAERLGAAVLTACVRPDLLDWVVALLPDGLRLCVENHWDQPLDRSAAVERALAPVPAARACVDTGHALLAGERPDRFVAHLGRLVGHVHLKDARIPPLRERVLGRRLRRRLLARPEPVVPGSGDLDVARLRAALAAAGYAGAVVAEHEGPDAEPALARLRALWHDAAQSAPARAAT